MQQMLEKTLEKCEKTLQRIINRLSDKSKSVHMYHSFDTWRRRLIEVLDTTYSDKDNSHPASCVLKGLLHNTLQFPQTDGITAGTRVEMHGKFLDAFHTEITQHCWNARCELIQKWEKRTKLKDGRTITQHKTSRKQRHGSLKKAKTTRKRKGRVRKRQRLENSDDSDNEDTPTTDTEDRGNLTQLPTKTQRKDYDRHQVSDTALKEYTQCLRMMERATPLLHRCVPLRFGLRTREVIQKYSKLRREQRQHSRTLTHPPHDNGGGALQVNMGALLDRPGLPSHVCLDTRDRFGGFP